MSLNLCLSGVHLATGVLMEFVPESLPVINKSNQQLPAMMNLGPDIGHSAASNKVRECQL